MFVHRHRQDDFFVVGLNKSPYFGVGNTNLKIDISMRKVYSLLQGVLDLTQCPDIVEVWCGESKLTGVDFATECPALETLICYDSKIEALNLSSYA